MKDDLKPEDLVEDPAFRAWVYHGTGDPDWKAWLHKHPDHQQTAELARTILLSVRGELDHLSGSEVKNRVQTLLAGLSTEQSNRRPLYDSPGRPLRKYGWWSAAAGIVLAIGLGTLFYSGFRETPPEKVSASALPAETADSPYREVTNESEHQKLVNLPDGSSVLLMKASGIRFPKQFAADKREVKLTGEAFFEVRKNRDHPFFVYAGEMVTRVIGTSFTISAYETDNVVKVRVKTGKVSVSAIEPSATNEVNAAADELVLEPNQQAVLSRSDLKIALLTHNKAASIPIETQSFEFRRTAVSDVFETIKAAYNVTIRYDADLLKHCSITASLGDEPLMEKLNMICEVMGATYRVADEIIYIDAGGCN